MNHYPHSTSTQKLYITHLSPDKNPIKCTIVKFLFNCIFEKQKNKTSIHEKGLQTQYKDKTNKALGKATQNVEAEVITRRRACALLALRTIKW